MSEGIGIFPFGEPVEILRQEDRSPKRAFVLGVYASAVHARWIGPDEKLRARALAVASEPEIFWRGDGAAEIIEPIEIPPALGHLAPAAARYNGPSGKALDEHILAPLGLQREDAWLCDLVPHACMNPDQREAIERTYLPVMIAYGLPEPSFPPVPQVPADAARRDEILAEIRASEADTLILLGDDPIRWFLTPYDPRWNRLRDFGTEADAYGRLHAVDLDGTSIDVLPVAHPRQVAQLGRSSLRWYELHKTWTGETAPGVLG